MNVTRDDLLKAPSLKRLGHVAFHLGLTEALARPMTSILGDAQRGRLQRELAALATRCQGEDLATLLAYGDEALNTKKLKPLKSRVLTLARSFLVRTLEGDAPPPPDVERPTKLDALQRWADEHHVRPLLNASVYRSLNATHPALFSGMVDQRVENGPFELLLGDRDLAQKTAIARPRLERLQKAAWGFLKQKADEAAEAHRAFAASGFGKAPSSDDRSPRANLIRRALQTRTSLVARVVARPPSLIRTEPYQVEDGSPPVFVHVEAPEDRYAFATKVRLPLDPDGPWRLECSAHKTPCEHQLAAVDALLALLQAGEASDLARIVEPIALPPWSRALKALDAVCDEQDDEVSADRSAAAVISWGVTLAGRRVEVSPWLQIPTKTGGLGKPRRIKPDKLLDGDYALDPDDQHIAELLELFQLASDPRSPRAQRVLQRALQRLVGHPRVVRQPDEASMTVRFGALNLVTVRSEGVVRLMPSVDDQLLSLEAFKTRNQSRIGRLMVHDDDGELVLVEVSPAFEAIVSTLIQHDFRLPERALPELIQRLPGLTSRVPIVVDREVPRASVRARRHLVLQLSPRGRGLTATATVEPLVDGPRYGPGEGPAEVVAVDDQGQLTSALRDRAQEAAWARDRLRTLLPNGAHEGWRYVLADPQDALMAVERLQSAEDVTVLWPGGQPWRIAKSEAGVGSLRLQVHDRRDWFGLHGDVEIDGHRVPIDGLVDAVRRDDAFVEVESGQWARISDELRDRLAAIEPHVRAEDGELSISPAATDALETLGSDADFVRSVRWQANLQRLQTARASEPPPPTLDAELRDYQKAGYEWMHRLATWGLGACLADDMGLGKTVQTLAIIATRAELGPQLVVAPTSVTYNWLREAERFCPTLQPVLYAGSDRGATLDALGPHSVLITSYGLLTRDIESLAAHRFVSLVLDEAQAIKNANSQRSSAVRQLDADWRLALSGTPVENHLGELWALFSAVSPGLLGRFSDFRDRFMVPIERDGHRGRADALSRLIRPFILRRTKQEVARELPPRTSIDLDIVLTDAEMSAYEDARTRAVADLARQDGAQGRFAALAALTRLRQLACHPRLVDPHSDLPSSKMARAMGLIRGLLETGQRALVFSQFTRHLGLLSDALDEAGLTYLYLDGQTPADERARRVERFQGGEHSLFLISLKAGGTGLTLTGADTVIHLDPWWNPAVEDQATDRAHRIGQTKPVTVYRLVAKGTIEEGILQLHANKRALVAQVLEGTQTAQGLSTDELIGLIQTGVAAG